MKPVDEVAEVVEQLAVVLQHEVVPAERAVLKHRKRTLTSCNHFSR